VKACRRNCSPIPSWSCATQTDDPNAGETDAEFKGTDFAAAEPAAGKQESSSIPRTAKKNSSATRRSPRLRDFLQRGHRQSQRGHRRGGQTEHGRHADMADRPKCAGHLEEQVPFLESKPEQENYPPCPGYIDQHRLRRPAPPIEEAAQEEEHAEENRKRDDERRHHAEEEENLRAGVDEDDRQHLQGTAGHGAGDRGSLHMIQRPRSARRRKREPARVTAVAGDRHTPHAAVVPRPDRTSNLETSAQSADAHPEGDALDLDADQGRHRALTPFNPRPGVSGAEDER